MENAPKKTIDPTNPLGLRGIEFIEFSAKNPGPIQRLFYDFGFSKTRVHRSQRIGYFQQNNIHFLLNSQEFSHGFHFAENHGPGISAMGWRVDNAEAALNEAMARGAVPCFEGDYCVAGGGQVPAIYGIGRSLIYLIDNFQDPFRYEKMGFEMVDDPEVHESKGFIAIDHLTNNVEQGAMAQWSDFYKNVFGFTEVRYFDIRGVKTGLTSYALKSPDGSFCIPINEGTEEGSQINEYLREYRGAGIQHLAFLTNDILASLRAIDPKKIETLDIDDEYYQSVFDRVPNVTEDRAELQKHNVLIDGDDRGYLLQIFTKNVVGPIFVEIIQRKNHDSFGEGNFGALFRSIERDQQRRGVL